MRADKFFAARYGSRTKAAQALNCGLVLCGGKALSPKDEVGEGDAFTFLSAAESFVSNGGYKLARGLDCFGQSVEGEVFADLGASTGGFTDCLLQRGARHVFCVDVGESLLDASVAKDSRVTVMDRTNARYLKRENFPVPLDGVVSDLSFISLKLILGAVSDLLDNGKRAFVLFKPQFECGGKNLGKNGILPRRYHGSLLRDFYHFCISLFLSPMGIVNAPLREKKNVEYIIFLEKGGKSIFLEEFLHSASSNFEENSSKD